MQSLSNTSRIVADELRRAKRSINLGTRDTAQTLLTTLGATKAHSLYPAITEPTVKSTVVALSVLVDGQDQMAMRARLFVEKVCRQLRLTGTSCGGGLPEPSSAATNEIDFPRNPEVATPKG